MLPKKDIQGRLRGVVHLYQATTASDSQTKHKKVCSPGWCCLLRKFTVMGKMGKNVVNFASNYVWMPDSRM